MKLGLEQKTEKRIEKLGCRKRLINAYRNRQLARGQIDVNGLRWGKKKTIEESVREWRESVVLLAGDDE